MTGNSPAKPKPTSHSATSTPPSQVSEQAIDQLGGADSTRGTTTLTNLRTQLTAHRKARPLADFLDLTA